MARAFADADLSSLHNAHTELACVVQMFSSLLLGYRMMRARLNFVMEVSKIFNTFYFCVHLIIFIKYLLFIKI